MSAQSEIAIRLFKDQLDQVTIVQVWNNLSAAQKAAANQALRAGNSPKLGRLLVKAASQAARQAAVTRAGEILADGELNAAEVAEIFG